MLSSLATSSLPWRLQPHLQTPGPAEQPEAPSGDCFRNVAEVHGAQAPPLLQTKVRDSPQICLGGTTMLAPLNPTTHPHRESERLGRRLSSTQHKAPAWYRNPRGQDSWSKGFLDSVGMSICPHPIPSWNPFLPMFLLFFQQADPSSLSATRDQGEIKPTVPNQVTDSSPLLIVSLFCFKTR